MEFVPFGPAQVLDATACSFPSRLLCLENESRYLSPENSHFYGFILRGRARLDRHGLEPITVSERMYFSSPAPFHLHCEGQAVLWEKLQYRGLFEVGGPVEAVGRLAYINGCTTTLICPPPRVLDPVLNLLCFPPQTKQTMHFHPTPRLGVVFAGSGECVRPGLPSVPIRPGSVFRIDANQAHCFHTDREAMRLIAFHPDSDTGPTDENHPMLNRTHRLPL